MNVLEQHKNKTIVYAVLNWGLGHATRSIPIIRQLLDSSNRVILLSDGVSLKFLQSEFPQIECRVTPRYNISYTTNSIWINVLKSINSLRRAIDNENKVLEEVVMENQVDLVISDGRFGVHSSKVESVFITHQVQIYSRVKVISYLATMINLSYINNFDTCWVMDTENNTAAGGLSESKGLKSYTYIGCYSRMTEKEESYKYDICVVLSGLEPKRTQLEYNLNAILSNTEYKICFVRGSAVKSELNKKDKIQYYDLLETEELNKLLCSSKVIICRSGYSSIMDLMSLNKSAILIPTRGQTEQEYLAYFHNQRGKFISLNEKDMSPDVLLGSLNQLLN